MSLGLITNPLGRGSSGSSSSASTTVETLTASANTITPNSSNGGGILTSVAAALTIANPTGSPTDMQRYILRIKSASNYALTFGNQYRFSSDLAQPATLTGSSLTDYFVFTRNAADSKWDFTGRVFGF